jgi:hypothetical protein
MINVNSEKMYEFELHFQIKKHLNFVYFFNARFGIFKVTSSKLTITIIIN